ncbi:hypothetical protein [Paenibacillus polymyxa]|uniref:hypothetical protein n=1 Tax=Paenibacillus polymyxa TaxID=1406 RepID=UPI00111850EA|nr:hypothetical protein [Paenibacillus polymyxa]QDA30194.1 hypothetical protein FGY93_25060 [Paenibacillus polymyxa]
MRIVFMLKAAMFHSDISYQIELINKINSLNITANVNTVNSIFNNKNIKQVPVDLIYGICVATNTSPGDWIKLVDDNGQEWVGDCLPLDSSICYPPGVTFLYKREEKESTPELIKKIAQHNIHVERTTIWKMEKNTLKRLPLDLILGISIITGKAPGDWIRVVDPNGNEIKGKGIRLDGTIVESQS